MRRSIVFFIAMVCVAYVVPGLPASAPTATIPIAEFARHAQYRDVKISPNGDYLAASGVFDGKASLALLRLSDLKGVTLHARDGDEVSRFWWASPKRVVYTVAEKSPGLEKPNETGELYAVDADGASARILIGYRKSGDYLAATPIEPFYSDGRRVLASVWRWNGSHDGAFPTAAWVDLDGGGSTRFSKTPPAIATAPIRNATFVADNHGRVRFAYATDTDQKLRVYYRSADGGDWQLVIDQSHGDAPVEPVRFNRDESEVYFDCGGSHHVGGICLWNVAKRTFKTLWSGTGAGPDGLLSTFDDQDIFAIRSMPGLPKTTMLTDVLPEATLLAALVPQFPNDDVVFTSHTHDAGKVVFSVASDTDPGQFFLYDAATHKASFLLARAPWLSGKPMSPMQPIELKARDGLILHGYLTKPANGSKSLPTVVYVHGGPFGIRDRWQFDPMVQLLASRGYAVLQVNFRGSGGYGRAFELAGHREWGGRMQDDVTDATRWAIAQGIADPRRICIFGASYGGYAALEGAVKEPDLYRCAIGYVGVYDLSLMYSRGDIPQSTYGQNYLKLALGDDPRQLAERSPIDHLDRLKAKVMLIVGGADTRVPPVQGERLHNALERAHVAHEWVYQRTEGHGFYDEKNVTDLYEKLTAFLAERLAD